MVENTTNPLAKYFRQPAIYIRLPSNGKFYPPGSIDMPANGEIPIYPMTAMDEIITRTPDALFNGSAVAQLIQSCVPNIKDPWSLPQIDIDMLFTAIRIASYGHEMSLTTTCPACNEEDEYALDLRHIIDQIKTPNFDSSLNLSDLEIYFKPLNYKEISDNSQKQFQETKKVQMSNESDSLSEEEKVNNMSLALAELTKLTLSTVSQSISAIKSEGQVIDDSETIKEFMNNIDSKLYGKIREHLENLRSESESAPLKIVCKKCNHNYEQPFTLDVSNFFV